MASGSVERCADKQLVHALGEVSWYSIFARLPDRGLAPCAEIDRMATSEDWISINSAHARLFARAVVIGDAYAKFMGDKNVVGLIEADVAKFKAAKLWEPAFDEGVILLRRSIDQ